jgi:hypothetical protein
MLGNTLKVAAICQHNCEGFSARIPNNLGKFNFLQEGFCDELLQAMISNKH